jgi:hypothetical protein
MRMRANGGRNIFPNFSARFPALRYFGPQFVEH